MGIGRFIGGVAGGTGLGVADRLAPSLSRNITGGVANRLRGTISHDIAGLTTSAALWTAKDIVKAPGTLLDVGYKAIRDVDRLGFNKVPVSFENLLGRAPKPWLVGSLAFAAVAGGASMTKDMFIQPPDYSPPSSEIPAVLPSQSYGGSYNQPFSPGEIPSFNYDSVHNPPNNMGATGDLVMAMHKNRHG